MHDLRLSLIIVDDSRALIPPDIPADIGLLASARGAAKSQGHAESRAARPAYALTILVAPHERGTPLPQTILPDQPVYVLRGVWEDGYWKVADWTGQALVADGDAPPDRLLGSSLHEITLRRRQLEWLRQIDRRWLTTMASCVFLLCVVLSIGLAALATRRGAVERAVNTATLQAQRDGEAELAAERLVAAARERSFAQALEDERRARSHTEAQAQRMEAQRQIDNLAREALALLLRDELEAAMRALEQAIERYREHNDEKSETLLLLSAGSTLAQKNRFAEAQPLLERVLKRTRKDSTRDSGIAAEAHAALAGLCQANGRAEEAAEHLVAAVKLRQCAWGNNDDPRLIPALQELARLQFQLKRYDQADAVCAHVLRLHGQLQMSDSPQAVDDLCLWSLAKMKQGALDDAAALCKRILLIEPALDSAQRTRMRASLRQLARLFVDRGRYTQGMVLLERALGTRDAIPAMDESQHDEWRLLARLYVRERRYAQAEVIYARLVGARETALGNEDPVLADDAAELAHLYERQGRLGQAEVLYKLSMEIREKVLGPYHHDVAKSAMHLADLYRIRGKTAQAEALYELAREIRKQSTDQPRS